MINILLLDNYDSFTYNLLHLVEESGLANVTVIRNDKISLDKIKFYDKIILSPGPGLPKDAGIMPKLIEQYAKEKQILGVCLGHQAIAEAFGGTLFNLSNVLHGVYSPINIIDKNEVLFRNIPQNCHIGHYHSWAVSSETLPECLKITAVAQDGIIMAMRHREYDICGVQFHPESVLTEYGITMITNWILS
jgi:anthranilate synthase component 2